MTRSEDPRAESQVSAAEAPVELVPDSSRRVSYCRICEAFCGIVVTTEGDRVVRIEGDRDHPLSKGYLCPKGAAMVDVQHDPDRVLRPLRRCGGPGEFEVVSWDAALDDIASRLRGSVDAYGPDSVAWYLGNPATWSFGHATFAAGFLAGLGSRQMYSSGSQDVNSRFAASALLYGNPLRLPIPDLARTSFLLMVGANPLVSHGSLVVAPRIRAQLDGIVARGGRVVVVDPRRNETARRYEHIGLRADTDAWLLSSLLQVIFAEDLADRVFLARHTRGVDQLERAVGRFPPEATAAWTGVESERVRDLARSLAAAECAAVYGRVGSCVGSFGTLVVALLDALNVVTGNLHRPGGAVFGHGAIASAKLGKRAGFATYASHRTRVGGFPEVAGHLPAGVLADEIRTPGPGQIRALVVSAGNPVLSVPDAAGLEAALGELDLLVSLDLYVNETNRHAHYVLPATTWLERPDVHVVASEWMVTPFTQATGAVVPPAGESREEWAVIDDLARRLGVQPYSSPVQRRLARLGLRWPPRKLLDLSLRAGPAGNKFGFRPGGLTLRRLERRPHGVVLADHIPTGRLRRKIDHRGGRVDLAPPEVLAQIDRLDDRRNRREEADFPLRLIGMRQARSHNSWMHNAPRLMGPSHQQRLLVHPDDAAAAGVEDGADVQVTSSTGSVVVACSVTEDMTPGNVALPHGWGHRGGWQLANQTDGANVNLLTQAGADHIEPLAGMSRLSGIPVRLAPA
jgi:anaerobic selenocysteine-containing dehydrogenase